MYLVPGLLLSIIPDLSTPILSILGFIFKLVLLRSQDGVLFQASLLYAITS